MPITRPLMSTTGLPENDAGTARETSRNFRPGSMSRNLRIVPSDTTIWPVSLAPTAKIRAPTAGASRRGHGERRSLPLSLRKTMSPDFESAAIPSTLSFFPLALVASASKARLTR